MRLAAPISICLFFVGLQSGCSSETNARIAQIKLPTIQCSACAKTVSDALKQLLGVEEINVDQKKQIAEVRYLAGTTDLAQLEMTVASAGYTANETKADPEAYGALPDCCKIQDKK